MRAFPLRCLHPIALCAVLLYFVRAHHAWFFYLGSFMDHPFPLIIICYWTIFNWLEFLMKSCFLLMFCFFFVWMFSGSFHHGDLFGFLWEMGSPISFGGKWVVINSNIDILHILLLTSLIILLFLFNGTEGFYGEKLFRFWFRYGSSFLCMLCYPFPFLMIFDVFIKDEMYCGQ